MNGIKQSCEDSLTVSMWEVREWSGDFWLALSEAREIFEEVPRGVGACFPIRDLSTKVCK